MKKNLFDDDYFYEQLFEILECDSDYLCIKNKLISYQKYEKFKIDIIETFENFFDKGKLKPYFGNNKIDEENFLSLLPKLIEGKRLKFKCAFISHRLCLPLINSRSISSLNTLFGEDTNESHLRESVYNLKNVYNLFDMNKTEIVWKSCQEIFPNKDLVILPEKLDYSCFNQGYIGDCYFISCVQALSQIPQLLNFILRLSTEDQDNQIAINNEDFKVNFFIDGDWKIINIKNNFPIIIKENGEYELVGVTPNENELFLMILEKAWAKINRGYDKIEGGNIFNIFELFLGCKCDNFLNTLKNNNVFVNDLYERIKLNEKFYGNLSLCGSNYYSVNENYKDEMKQNKYTYDKKECLKKEKLN